MALETATYIDGLVATNPVASDAISTADDHLRLIKSTIKATFPNLTGPVTKTQAEINGLAPLASPTFTGTPAAPTAAPGTNTTQLATTAFATAAAIAAFPSGGIIMWSGSIATIPSGWFLCNGANGTPDLRDRFIIGASQDSTGEARTNVTGSLTKTGGSKDAIVVSHTHTASTNSTGAHTHTQTTDGSDSDTHPNGGVYASGSNFSKATTTSTASTLSAGSHSHTVTVDSTGSSGTNANLPPYFALAFIMKA